MPRSPRASQRAVRRRTFGGALAVGAVLAVLGAGIIVVVHRGDDSLTGSRDTSATAPSTTRRHAATTSTSVAPTTTIAPRTITLAFTGDVLLHSPVNRQAARIGAASGVAYDYRPMFEAVRSRLGAADLAFCHLETPIAPAGTAITTYPRFSVPAEIAPALAYAGYDGCSTASNHAYDGGERGVVATLDALDAAGVGHAGTARTPQEAAAPRVYEARGVRVAHLSYTWGLNGLRLPADRPHLANVIDDGRILADAAVARAAGASVVVVSLHWGAEFVRDPTTTQRELAARLAASPDVDVIVGHHAHVVQPVAAVGDTVVAYGLGNFLSNQHASSCCPAASQDGVIVEYTLRETGRASDRFAVADVAYTATWVNRSGFTIVPVAAALADPATPAGLRPDLAASARRTDDAVHTLGATAHPAAP